MSKYVVDSADLVSVAEAIRTKGKTSEQLVFPSGFVSAVEAITTGGGGLNFTVVGGTTEPTDPAENTVWVDTNTDITGWEFGFDQPDTSTAGFVWIKSSPSSPMQFNAISENAIILKIATAYQLIGGTWELMPTKVYTGGEWLDDYGVIYDGTWRSPYSFAENDLLDNNANPIEWTVSQSSRAVIYNVDFTDFDTLEIDCEFVNNYWTYISVTDNAGWADGAGSNFVYKKLDQGTFARQVYSLPVTDITGGHIIKIHLWGTSTTVKVYRIQLVKNG